MSAIYIEILSYYQLSRFLKTHLRYTNQIEEEVHVPLAAGRFEHRRCGNSARVVGWGKIRRMPC